MYVGVSGYCCVVVADTGAFRLTEHVGGLVDGGIPLHSVIAGHRRVVRSELRPKQHTRTLINSKLLRRLRRHLPQFRLVVVPDKREQKPFHRGIGIKCCEILPFIEPHALLPTGNRHQ